MIYAFIAFLTCIFLIGISYWINDPTDDSTL